MTKEKENNTCRFASILRTIDSLDMQISRIKNQLTELKMIVRAEENDANVKESEHTND